MIISTMITLYCNLLLWGCDFDGTMMYGINNGSNNDIWLNVIEEDTVNNNYAEVNDSVQ